MPKSLDNTTSVKLEDIEIHAFLQKYQVKNETGVPIDFKDHMFLFDIYRDFSPKLVVTKAAQVGMTTAEIIKVLWGVKNLGLDAIYTLPTYSDVQIMVGSKVNRIINQNPILQEWVKERETLDQKQVGKHYIHFKGTWTEKAAMMIPSDWNLYDEIDASNQAVIEQYATRLQHSKHKFEHYFSHPSAPNTGVDKYWQKSDQKHWFVTCDSCRSEQYLSWPESITEDERGARFTCKSCKEEITDSVRRKGRWVAKYPGREYSGYWVPLLICPWVSAKEIIAYNEDKSEEYFYNKVLGLPFVGGGNKLTKQAFEQNLTDENLYPDANEMVVMGLDTGTSLYYVLGSEKGLFHYGVAKDYQEIEDLMARWPRMMVICDQMGDLIGSRALREKYPGRVWLCLFGEDRKTKELVRWGKNDEHGAVIADRNRSLQLVVDEFTSSRIRVMGTIEDWDEYMLHWNNLTRIKEYDSKTNLLKAKKWVKNGQSDFPFATVYWRIGMMRFSGIGKILPPKTKMAVKVAPEILPEGKMQQTKKIIFADTNEIL